MSNITRYQVRAFYTCICVRKIVHLSGVKTSACFPIQKCCVKSRSDPCPGSMHKLIRTFTGIWQHLLCVETLERYHKITLTQEAVIW